MKTPFFRGGRQVMGAPRGVPDGVPVIGCLAVLGVALILAAGPRGPEPAPAPAVPDPAVSAWLPWFMGGAPPALLDPAPAPPAPEPLVRAEFWGLARSAWYTGRYVGPRTCASRVFERGVWLILQAEAGGPRVPVRVNDYGPADPATGTLFDVSRDVAEAQGWRSAGHARIRVWRVAVRP